jgi:Tfp pilus assembly protein PilV
MKIKVNQRARQGELSSGFTLLEVIIACTIFFMVAFSVLQVVTTGLVAAKKLQQREPEFEFLASPHAITNILIEGSASGDFEDVAPGLYPGYSWEWTVQEVGTNFFRADYMIYNNVKGASAKTLTTFYYKPGSPPGSFSKGGL